METPTFATSSEDPEVPNGDEDPELPEEQSNAPEYWAKKKGKDFVSAVLDKQSRFYDSLERRGFLEMMRNSYCAYYGQDPGNMGSFATQQLGFGGDEGELVDFRVNEARSFARQQITMVTSQRPAFKCMALNTDYSSISQIESSDTIVSYFYEQELGEAKEALVVESDVIFGWGYGWARWDVDGGDEFDSPVMQTDPETGQETPVTEPVMMPLPDGSSTEFPKPVTEKKKSGQPLAFMLYPWEVPQEPNATHEHMWRIVRERASKWEVAATWPEHAETISNTSTMDEYTVESLFGFDHDESSEDDCIIKHFYHKRCTAIPDGRYVGICGDVILWDRPCPIPRGMPIEPMCTASFIGTSLGYSDHWDLLSLGQMIDQMCSDTATNLSTFGRQVLIVDEGTDFDPEALANGMKVLTKQSTDQPPTALSFAEMPEAVKWFLDFLLRRMESISGLNSVARGNPDASVKSGAHAALFHSIAIEFQNARQAALDRFRKGFANLLLDLIRMNAEGPFLVEVGGKDQRTYLQEFTKQSIAGVRRVRVETANPMMKSQAGRLQIWEEIKDLDDDQRAKAIELITTGRFEPLTRSDRACYMRIKWENEQLSKCKPTPVLAGDDPFKHVPEHFAEIEAMSSQIEAHPEVLESFMNHIMEHITQYPKLDPFLAVFRKIKPPPAAPGMPLNNEAPSQDGHGGASPKKEGAPHEADPGSGIPLPKPSEPPKGSGVENAPAIGQ